jgi:hypothetical protein
VGPSVAVLLRGARPHFASTSQVDPRRLHHGRSSPRVVHFRSIGGSIAGVEWPDLVVGGRHRGGDSQASASTTENPCPRSRRGRISNAAVWRVRSSRRLRHRPAATPPFRTRTRDGSTPPSLRRCRHLANKPSLRQGAGGRRAPLVAARLWERSRGFVQPRRRRLANAGDGLDRVDRAGGVHGSSRRFAERRDVPRPRHDRPKPGARGSHPPIGNVVRDGHRLGRR